MDEYKTVGIMIKMYCDKHHSHVENLCSDCNKLLSYAHTRLKNCNFKKDKPFCSKCPIHCYEEPMRGEIRKIMRYSGPRMLLKHPILALLQLMG
ncbi:MAG: nitrous oxide-stimulated promoter family protein [Candidatus Omnitrophica bacterium]|nr:nitrous oxide-stimulated promoter family protein [Candidatus Omnitrophota bacterium]